MRTLYVVAHPEATHVVDGVVGGWYDADLTAVGLEHTRLIADALAVRLPTLGGLAVRELVVRASDLRRTRLTGQAVAARLGADLVLDEALRERSYGVAEGRPVGTVPGLPPPATGDRLNHDDGVEGSETRLDVASRVYAAVERIVATDAESAIVVTHGGAATYVIAAWLGMPLASVGAVRFRVSPGSITTLTEDDATHDRVLAALDDVTHLTPAEPPVETEWPAP